MTAPNQPILDRFLDLFSFIPAADEKRLRRRILREYQKSQAYGILPRQLAIETVNHCNAACVMCPYPTLEREKGFMTPEAHKVIVDKVAEWGAPIELISHAGMGEPLLDRTLTDKITYEAVMKLPYERTQNNLHRFVDMNASLGKPVEIHVSLIPTEHHTADEIERFRAYWGPLVNNVIVPPLIGWGGHFKVGTTKKQYSCRYIWQVLQVDWDGTVAMCCEDYETRYPLGNLLSQSPDEVYNSPMFQAQRMRQVAGDFAMPEVCVNCVESHEVARDFWRTADIIPAPANKPSLKVNPIETLEKNV